MELNDDVIRIILSNLDIVDQVNFGSTNKRFNDIVKGLYVKIIFCNTTTITYNNNNKLIIFKINNEVSCGRYINNTLHGKSFHITICYYEGWHYKNGNKVKYYRISIDKANIYIKKEIELLKQFLSNINISEIIRFADEY